MLTDAVADLRNDTDIEQYDLIIIGSGSGNAIPDYLGGWKIAIVERSTFGGTFRFAVNTTGTSLVTVMSNDASDVENGIDPALMFDVEVPAFVMTVPEFEF